MAVDEAALEAFLASDGQPEPANEATEQAVESQVAETPEPQVEDTIPEGDKFDRTYVEKLRRESASYRERAKRYQEAFDGYEDGQVEAWLGLAKQLREDPQATAAELQALAEQINAAYASEQAKLESQEVEQDQAEQQYLSKADVERMFRDREEKADLERRVAKIESDARELGYEPGSEQYDELLWFASRTKQGSIQEAHAQIQARDQAIYDRMIEKMGGKGYKVPEGTTPINDTDRKLKTFEDANDALEAWLASQG